MNSNYRNKIRKSGITIVEVVAALVLLGIISSVTLVSINRSLEQAADLKLKMKAFEVARNNMERLLVQTEIEEMTEYGTSEKYPDIEWETTVESFEPGMGAKMWVRAVCSASYIDAFGETQKVEFVNWLTSLTEEQRQVMTQFNEQKQTEETLRQNEELEENPESIDEEMSGTDDIPGRRDLPPPPPL